MSADPIEPLAGQEPDKVTFGPSALNEEVLNLLVAQGHFTTALGAFQSAAMFAIRKGLDVEAAPNSAGTKWNRGSIDPQIRDFLEWYVPTTRPTRVLEQLGNVGTAFIAERVRSGGYNLSEVFELPEMEIN